MRITWNAKIIGMAIGLLAGVLLVLVGWRVFLILLGFVLAGYLVGTWLDSREDVARRFRQLFDRLFRP